MQAEIIGIYSKYWILLAKTWIAVSLFVTRHSTTRSHKKTDAIGSGGRVGWGV